MNDEIRILVVEEGESISLRLNKAMGDFGMDSYQIITCSSFDKESFETVDCLIIDSSLVGDVKELIRKTNDKSIQKVIVVIDQLNHPISNATIMLGGQVFYKDSPITSLVYKIYDSFKPNKGVPDTYNYKDLESGKGSKLIAVHSPKGGTGTTTIAINLASQYARKDLKVLLIDMALYGNVGVNLKVSQRGKGLSNILSHFEQEVDIGAEAKQMGKMSENIFSHKSGDRANFDVITSAASLRMENITVEDVEILLSSIRRLEYDVVIIDTSSELSIRNLATFEMADDIIMVASPDIGSGWNLIQLKEILDNVGISKKCKLVVNLYSKYVGFSCRELEMELAYPLIGIIPYDEEIKFLQNQGTPIALREGNKTNTILMKRLAHSLVPIFSQDEIQPQTILGIILTKLKNTVLLKLVITKKRPKSEAQAEVI